MLNGSVKSRVKNLTLRLRLSAAGFMLRQTEGSPVCFSYNKRATEEDSFPSKYDYNSGNVKLYMKANIKYILTPVLGKKF